MFYPSDMRNVTVSAKPSMLAYLTYSSTQTNYSSPIYVASFVLYYTMHCNTYFIMHIAIFVVVWLTSQSHDINKSLKTVRKSSIDSIKS